MKYRIRKTSTQMPMKAQVLNDYSESSRDTYSSDYLNRLLEDLTVGDISEWVAQKIPFEQLGYAKLMEDSNILEVVLNKPVNILDYQFFMLNGIFFVNQTKAVKIKFNEDSTSGHYPFSTVRISNPGYTSWSSYMSATPNVGQLFDGNTNINVYNMTGTMTPLDYTNSSSQLLINTTVQGISGTPSFGLFLNANKWAPGVYNPAIQKITFIDGDGGSSVLFKRGTYVSLIGVKKL